MTNVSYLKTQWWRLLLAVVFLVIACVYLFSPAADESTVEGLKESTDTMFSGMMWFATSMYWFIISFIYYNETCIRELDKKNQELKERILALENRAITDIEEDSPNNYTCFRRLGPDKDT